VHSAHERPQFFWRSHSRCVLLNQVIEPSRSVFRNFNVCPHCEWNGEEALLFRLSEGIPMISRSDGRNFHLLLADRPLPYPAESGGEPTPTVSVCFWYQYGAERDATKSTVVLFEGVTSPKGILFRQIEFIADVLADELLRRQNLAVFYNMKGNAILESAY
jgi:hypothetical protein